LSANQFSHFNGLDDDSLAQHGTSRRQIDMKPGSPCRVALEDADIGESVLLLDYEHLTVDTPYRAPHAISVREGATASPPIINRIPKQLKIRLLSIRAYDTDVMIVDADVVHGKEAEPVRGLLKDQRVDYLHIHNAKSGCYAAPVDKL
jgi:hypothetical protein